jgi:type IV pilus assembly protein PilV
MLMDAQMCTRGQQGSTHIEGLVAIVIFSIGILGMVALQASAINLSSDAKYRGDAAFLANQILGQLAVADPAQLADFSNRPDGKACSPTGSDSTNAVVTAWLTQVDKTLPGAAASKQQIKVDTGDKSVTVTLCWQPPNGSAHHHTVSSQLQWQ